MYCRPSPRTLQPTRGEGSRRVRGAASCSPGPACRPAGAQRPLPTAPLAGCSCPRLKRSASKSSRSSVPSGRQPGRLVMPAKPLRRRRACAASPTVVLKWPVSAAVPCLGQQQGGGSDSRRRLARNQASKASTQVGSSHQAKPHRRLVGRHERRGRLPAELGVRKGRPAGQVVCRLELEQHAGGLAPGAALGCSRGRNGEGERAVGGGGRQAAVLRRASAGPGAGVHRLRWPLPSTSMLRTPLQELVRAPQQPSQHCALGAAWKELASTQIDGAAGGQLAQ